MLTHKQPTRVLLAGRAGITLDGVAALLEREPDIDLAGVATDVHALNGLIDRFDPDVLISLGGTLQVTSGANGSIATVEVGPDDQSGAIGLVEAIRSAAGASQGKQPTAKRKSRGLSTREQEVVSLIGEGRANRDIAQRLGLSEQSVKNMVSKILKKRGYTNRVQIALEHRAEAS